MNVYEMEGFLRGKCLPGDLKVNESNAEYLVRKLRAVSELQGEVTALVATLGKSREVSGCPEGIDLQDWVKQLAEESLTLKQFPEQIVKFIGSLGSSEIGSDTKEKIELAANRIKTPATDRIVAGIKADGRVEGAHFVANRMLAAWDAGFIEDSAKNAADIARMILTSTEFMADAPEGDFDRSFADGILEDIAKQLRGRR